MADLTSSTDSDAQRKPSKARAPVLVLLLAAGLFVRPRSASAEPNPHVPETAERPDAEESSIPNDALPLPAPQPQDSAGSGWLPRLAPPPEVPVNAANTAAVRYASLGQGACEAELRRRKVPFVRVDSARGVQAPVRLRGPLSGVTYRSQIPEKTRATSPYEIFDCRLVLALDDYSKLLQKLDVVEVVHYSAYRPPPTRGWVSGRVGSRHGGALALDIGRFVKKDGTSLDVEKHFHGRIGARTCGPSTGPVPATPEALELRSLACDAASAHLFNVILTPNYNWAHRNHFHVEVTSAVKWFIVH